MKKINKQIKQINKKMIILMFSFLLIALMSMIWVIFVKNSNENLALIIVIACLIGLEIIMYNWKSKFNEQNIRKIFDVDEHNPRKMKKILHGLLLILFVCSLILVRQLNIEFWIVSIFMLILFFISCFLLTPKILVVDYNGIRNTFKWNLKWNKIKSYNLDKTIGVLIVEKIDGKKMQVTGIKKDDVYSIEFMIAKYINEEDETIK